MLVYLVIAQCPPSSDLQATDTTIKMFIQFFENYDFALTHFQLNLWS